MTTRLKRQRKKPTAKFCDNIRKEGEYLDYSGPVSGLILKVGPNGSSKSWLLRYRFNGRRPEMGLGSYPDISLAAARKAGGKARELLARDINPVEHRKEQRQKQWLADKKNLTFLAVAAILLT